VSGWKRDLGVPVILTADLAISLTITCQNSVPVTKTLNVNVSVAAGTYEFDKFMIAVEEAIRTGIFNAIATVGGMTNLGTADDISMALAWSTPSSETASYMNASRVNLSVTNLNANIGALPAVIIAPCTLNNAPAWAHYLGLGGEADASVAMGVSAGVATASGQFQPRYEWCFVRSEQDLGEGAEYKDYHLHRLKNGDVRKFNSGTRPEFPRSLRLVDMDPEMLAPQRLVGNLKSINADRVTLEFSNPKRTGVTGWGTAGPYLQGDRIALGCYVRVDEWVGRARSVTVPAPPALATVILWDKIPSTVAPPSGWPIYRASEGHALFLEAVRLGHLIVHEAADDTGEVRGVAADYAISDDNGRLSNYFERNSSGVDRYSVTLGLTRRSRTGFAVI
jgi:hypothetical protein